MGKPLVRLSSSRVRLGVDPDQPFRPNPMELRVRQLVNFRVWWVGRMGWANAGPN